MEDTVTNSPTVALLGFLAVIVLLLFLIARYKWHVFTALLVPILLLALVPTIDRVVFIEAFEEGFGGTIASIAVVIVLGSLIAEVLRNTGAVERITQSLIRLVGKRNMALALTLAGFVIGLAVFSDIGYIILNPLVHTAAIEAGVSMGVMATGLVGALQLTHAVVPPTPGPIAAAAVVEADLGTIILYGSIVTLVGSLAGWGYARLVGARVPSPPSEEFRDDAFVKGERRMPPLGWAYAPILIPLVLITGGSIVDFLVDRGTLAEGGAVQEWANFLGWPVVALGIGVVLAYWMSIQMTGKADQENRRDNWVESALRTSAMIIMVTGLGGALSELLQATPAVDVIAENTLEWGIPAILLPFLLGVLANMITGSTTVGVITGASLSAPMLDVLALSPEAAMLSAACGSVIIKYVNSSYFWVCTSLSRMPLRSALISYGGVTLVGGVSSMLAVVILWSVGAI